MGPGQVRLVRFDLVARRRYAVVIASTEPNDVDLCVLSPQGEILGADGDPTPLALVVFDTPRSGSYVVAVTNVTQSGIAPVLLGVLTQ